MLALQGIVLETGIQNSHLDVLPEGLSGETMPKLCHIFLARPTFSRIGNKRRVLSVSYLK